MGKPRKRRGYKVPAIVAGAIIALIAAAAVMAGSGIGAAPISTAGGSPTLGSPGAPVTIIEFGDYQCHACHAWFLYTKPAVERDYIDTGMAKLVFVDLAFLGRDSPKAAEAAHCAGDQGMYWEYHNTLYNAQKERIDSWAGVPNLKAWAGAVGLDTDAFEQCLDSGTHAERVRANVAEARKAGASSTPTFVILGPDGQREKIVGAQPYDVFQRTIDPML